jgi:serine/threonine protein phosphatase PrpC
MDALEVILLGIETNQNEGLAVSRAFGDKDHVPFGLIAEPNTTSLQLTSTDTLLILACDGVFITIIITH